MTETPIPGLKHQILLTVEKHHTADAYGNPGVEVFATPALITLRKRLWRMHQTFSQRRWLQCWNQGRHQTPWSNSFKI